MPFHRDGDPERWLELAYADAPVVTQVDDGQVATNGVGHHHPDEDGPYRVYQLGPHRLWDEVEAAHQWWVDQGSPGADQWRFQLGPHGQQISLARTS